MDGACERTMLPELFLFLSHCKCAEVKCADAHTLQEILRKCQVSVQGQSDCDKMHLPKSAP